MLKVKFSKGNFWQWRHNRYQHVKKDSMKARLSGAIHEEFCRQQREAEKLAPPSKPPMTQPVRARDVHDTLTALSGMTRIADDIELGSWLVDRETGQKRNLLPCHNGIVDLDAILDGALVDDPKVLLAHTPQLFSSVCLPYDYDPTATCPEFVRFLHQVLEGDLERIDLLLEFFGYTLTPDNAYQRYLMLYGFGCNGKTVVDTVLSEMLGDQNTSRVSLHRFSDRFSAFQMVLYFPRLR